MEAEEEILAEYKVNDYSFKLQIKNATSKFVIDVTTSDHEVYSADYDLTGWEKEDLMGIFSKPPEIKGFTQIENVKLLQLKWKSFPLCELRLISPPKSAPITEYENRIQNLENFISLMFQTKQRKKHLKEVVKNAKISGPGLKYKSLYIRTRPIRVSETFSIFKFPEYGSDRYVRCDENQWLLIDLQAPQLIKKIIFRFLDSDGRTYTYSLQVSQEGDNWEVIRDKQLAYSREKIVFDSEKQIQFMRIGAKNSCDRSGLQLHQFILQ
jgi:hypothetical protein